MNRVINLFCGISIVFAAQSVLACEYPTRASVPNGGTATKEEMVAGQKAVKSFVSEMETYLECIVDEEQKTRAKMEDLEPEEEQQREDMLTKKYNAAVDDMEKVAAQFNTEVQTYKARGE